MWFVFRMSFRGQPQGGIQEIQPQCSAVRPLCPSPRLKRKGPSSYKPPGLHSLAGIELSSKVSESRADLSVLMAQVYWVLTKGQALSRCFRYETIWASKTLCGRVRWIVLLIPFIGQETVLGNLKSVLLLVKLPSGRGSSQIWAIRLQGKAAHPFPCVSYRAEVSGGGPALPRFPGGPSSSPLCTPALVLIRSLSTSRPRAVRLCCREIKK